MIEVKGPDGRVFKFPVGTNPQIIAETMRANYPDPMAQSPVDEATDAAAPNGEPAAAAPTPAAHEYSAPKPSYSAPIGEPSDDDGFEDDAPAIDRALDFTKTVATIVFVAALCVLGFWFLRDKLPNLGPVHNGATSAELSQSYRATPQPDVRQASVPTQIRSEAKTDANIVQEVAEGAVLDVLGEQTIAGQTWARVRLSNSTSQTGWVIAEHLSAMGGLELQGITPEEPGMGNMVAQQPTTIAPSAMPPSPYYIAVRLANLRAAPNPQAPIVNRLPLGTAVMANQQADFEGRVWFYVRDDQGRSGWLNSTLTSTTPVDVVAAAAPPPPINDTGPSSGGGINMSGRAPSGYYVQVGAAQAMGEVEDLHRRVAVAKRCVGALPNHYSSDAFVNSRGGMVLSNFGPFSTRAAARAYADRLSSCIPDAYVISQP